MASSVVGALKVLLSLDTASATKSAQQFDQSILKISKTLAQDWEPNQKRVNALVKGFIGEKEIGLAKSYAEAVKQAGGAAKLTADDQAKVNRVVKEALTHYKALGVEAPANLKALAAATKGVEAPTKALSGNIDGLISKGRALAGVFGVTLGAAAIGSFIKSTFNAADQVGDLALKMGVSVEAAQRFQFAARQSGAEIEDVSRAIVAMNKNLAEGDKSTVGALEAAGLRFADIRAKKPEEAFRSIADAIARIPDPMLQSKVAMELFGKSGAEILPMIRENSLKAADAINVMGDETVRRLKDAKQAWENFWNGLTVISADAIVGIMNQWNKMMADLRTGVMFLAGLAKGGITFAFQMAEADVAARNFAAGKPMRDMQSAMTSPSVMSSHGPSASTFLTKEEREELDKKAKAATEAQRKLNESYRAFERERLTGLTDAQRQRQEFEARFLRERGLTAANAWAQSIVSKSTNWASLLTGGAMSIPTAPGRTANLPMSPIDIKKLTRGALDVEDLLRGVTIPALTFGQQFSNTIGMLPQTILQAFTGGGGVGKSIGGLLGGGLTGGLGTSLGKSLSGSFLGKTLGGAIGSVIPGIGTLLGGLLGGVVGKIGSIGKNTTKGSREDFAGQLGFGSLGDLYKQLQGMGAAGVALANVGMNVIGKKDEAANRKWMADVTTFLDAVPKKMAALQESVARFGGFAPKAVQPFIQSLLAMNNLPADLRTQLEGMTKPSWQLAAERASALGVDPGSFGRGFNQARIASQAFDLQHDIELFEQFNKNIMDFLPGLGDELSALAKEAIKTGTALPKTLEPYIKQLDAMGLLLDENGDRIDMGALSFADIEDESLKAIKDVLEDIRDLLAGKLPDAVRKFGTALGQLPVDTSIRDSFRGPVAIDDMSMTMPDVGAFNAQYAASFSSPGMPGVSASDMNVNLYVSDTVSFEQFLRQGGAASMVRVMPDVLERWGRSQ